MTVETTISAAERGHVIHRSESGQEVLGPAKAKITVFREPDLSPYEVQVFVELRDGRYDVDELHLFSRPEQPPVTARGLQDIRLPEIIRRALVNEVTVRRTTEDGRTVTGVSPDDEVPIVYLTARAAGENPTQAVQEAFDLPTRQAAAQKVARARKAGRIPPTTRGAR